MPQVVTKLVSRTLRHRKRSMAFSSRGHWAKNQHPYFVQSRFPAPRPDEARLSIYCGTRCRLAVLHYTTSGYLGTRSWSHKPDALPITVCTDRRPMSLCMYLYGCNSIGHRPGRDRPFHISCFLLSLDIVSISVRDDLPTLVWLRSL